MDQLHDRIRHIIDTFYDGRLREAARQLSVPHTTLARLMLPDRTPRVDSLQSIARHHRTTVDWLLGGDGPEPTDVPELSRRRQLKRMPKEELVEMILRAERQ